MKISRSWIQSYVDLQGISDEEIARAITFLGFEVEETLSTGAPELSLVVVGRILTRDKHPNADKLSVCTVDVGDAHGGVRTIVCGASNCDAGNYVPVALPGAVLPGNFTIKESKIRGQASSGMLCAASELSLEKESAGLLLLQGTPQPGTAINAVLPAGDTVFDIEVTPNRPDCLSHLGIARELAAWFRGELRYPGLDFDARSVAGLPPSARLRSVRVEDAAACPLYTATVIEGVKVAPSPEWIQRRLSAVGLRPINNIVDIGNYVMLEYGQPVHAFDAHKLEGAEILVRRARAGETIVTLDDKTHTLTPDDLVIADAGKPVVIAGIMGSENAGVSETTRDLVLEVAIFERLGVRFSSRRLGLSSDSSYRYERAVDAHTLEKARSRFVDLVLKYAGGVVTAPVVTAGAEAPWKREVTLSPAYVNARVGFEIPGDEIRSALESLELRLVREEAAGDGSPSWTFAIPSWRRDLARPIDLVEEVLRLYGTEKIPAGDVVATAFAVEEEPLVSFNRAAAAQLVGQNFGECVNYTLRPSGELDAWAGAETAGAYALENPFVEDQSHLRVSLIGGLLETVRLNQSRGAPVSRLFELGRVFARRDKGGLVECVSAGFVIVTDTDEAAWRVREAADFYTSKRLIGNLAALAGIDFDRQPCALVAEAGRNVWQAGHAAASGNIQHGWAADFGLVNLALTQKLGITGRVFAGALRVLPDKLSKTSLAKRHYRPLNLMPAALRDLALIVDADAPAADVQKRLTKTARAVLGNAFALESVQIFDVYSGKGLPEGKKSFAFSLCFRAEDRTLKDTEVNEVFNKIQDTLTAETGYQIRK